jgi:hypothetical protein
MAPFLLSGCEQKHNSADVSGNSVLPIQQNLTEENSSQNHPLLLQFKKYTEKMYSPLNRISKKNVVIIREDKLNKASLIIYRKENVSNDKLYAGYFDGSIYEIGQIGYGKDTQAIQVSNVNVFDRTFIKVVGFCGADCHVTNYLSVENKIPTLFLQLNMATTEIDLDGDGKLEIVASSGTPTETTLFKYKDGQLLSVSLNEALGALSVTVLPDGIIEAYFAKTNSTLRFKLIHDQLFIIQ